MRSNNKFILGQLGYSGPQFYCNTACVRQNFGESKNEEASACFCAGLSLFEYVRGCQKRTLAPPWHRTCSPVLAHHPVRPVLCGAQTLSRSQQLWVLYSTCKTDPSRDYLNRPWCVYELAMYVQQKKKRKEPVEIEVISLSTQLGMKLTRFIQLCMIACVATFLHMFAFGVALYGEPYDPDATTLEDWKAGMGMLAVRNGIVSVMTVGGSITFLCLVVWCIFKATLSSEREDICNRLKTFSWEDVKSLIQKHDPDRKQDVEEVEKRIKDRYTSIAAFEKEVRGTVQKEFGESLERREWRITKTLLTFWFQTGWMILGMAGYAADLPRPVVMGDDIPKLRVEAHALWSAFWGFSVFAIGCISCGGVISLVTAGMKCGGGVNKSAKESVHV